VVVASRRSVEQKVWQTSQYEFEDVIAEVDDVAWCLPAPVRAGPAGHLARGALNRAGRRIGRPRRAAMAPPRVHSDGVDADLLFAAFADANEIGMLPHVQPQVRRAAARTAWIMELWSPQLPSVTDYLRQLSDFDHVFVANRSVVGAVEEITGVPCSYLPGAADTATYAPIGPDFPARTVDVTSYGRRLPGTHEPLLQALAEGRLNYVYDTVRGAWDVTGHVEHRIAQAALLQRSRYAIVYRINDEPSRVDRTGGEESLTNRYFESLAAGAVMLGSAPDSQEWADCFPWPDALITIPAPAPDVVGFIEELDRDPARLARARAAAVTTFLRRHDWAHRWQQVLASVGMDELPQLTERLASLQARADAFAATPTG
jgi:glycosyl transferase family 1